MIEVDSLRRTYNLEHYDSQVLAPQSLPVPQNVPLDKSRVLVHWNQEPEKGAKSDGEDEDSDEYRPFTPPPPRERLSYTRYQLELLNGIYNEVRYPNSTQKQLIAKRVGITREQVKIWFQNRRRKDVVGTGKAKQNDSTSSISSNSSKDSEEKADDNESSSEESVSGKESPKDSDESVVPDVVLKSVINELIRFINDPLKGKKNRKKSKSKQKEKAALKKGLTNTLLAGGYDMISPPNQITPSAFFEKVKNGFNHSKGSSAFESPRDGPRPVQINGVSSSSHNSTPATSNNLGSAKTSQPNLMNHMGFLPNGFIPNGYSHMSLQSHLGNLPVLSDMFPYRPLDTRPPPTSASSQTTPLSPASARTENGRNIYPSGLGLTPDAPGRYLGGIFPFPYLAEQPMLLSSARQPDQIYRPSPKYALPKFGEDPYQPLMISSLSNPYYSSASMTSWTNHSLPTPSTYTNL